jgi:hypothetical protein
MAVKFSCHEERVEQLDEGLGHVLEVVLAGVELEQLEEHHHHLLQRAALR